MPMRPSDATFLRREILPALTAAGAISPEAAQAAEALVGRMADAAWMSDPPPAEPTLRWYTYSEELRHSRLDVDGHQIPYIEAARGADWPAGAVSLTLDNRYGMDTTEDELARWAPFLANAMAVSAGRTSHGENSYIRNPHGRSGGGDPPPLVGDPVAEVPAPDVVHGPPGAATAIDPKFLAALRRAGASEDTIARLAADLPPH